MGRRKETKDDPETLQLLGGKIWGCFLIPLNKGLQQSMHLVYFARV